jgi:uncharacterized damage-inducible protein DinB
VTIPRTDPQPSTDERTMLVEFLDYYRATIEQKADGIDDAQARVRIEPSDMTLIGLVRHLTEVERNWFRAKFIGEDAPYYYCTEEDEDADFHPGPDDTLADALAVYRAECERARAITNAAASLDEFSVVGVRWYDHRPVSLRWILVHMIEETARHAGHADLLRETIDGVTGD